METDEGLPLTPEPGILIESLRDIGYSFESALADVIDNSLAAHATDISVFVRPADGLSISIVDDGDGLSRENLLKAMRLGSTSPRVVRKAGDLGRFGLGMKTASFSQCRRLTVVSRKDGSTAAFTWDLDVISGRNKWVIIERNDWESIPEVSGLGEHGTLVLWQKVDRLTGEGGSGKASVPRLISQAREHLSLVFHRFLTGEPGTPKVRISVNNTALQALDPFNVNNPATSVGTEEEIIPHVFLRPFTLPHRSMYDSQNEYDCFGLPGGYLRNQGVYLYRAKRLIIHGTWFGIAKKTALTQLARVRVDIGTDQDEAWKIDVKKVSAQPPEAVRKRLGILIHAIGAPSKRVYQRRGARLTSDAAYPLWDRIENAEKSTYSINREHPVIRAFRDKLEPEQTVAFDSVLSLIESGLPTDALFYDLANNAENVNAQNLSDDDLRRTAVAFFKGLRQMGHNYESALSVMSASEPFQSHWQETLAVLNATKERTDE